MHPEEDLGRAANELLKDVTLIVASNRGPVASEPGHGFQLTRGAGGLVNTLASILEASGATWVAAASGPEDRKLALSKAGLDLPHGDPKYRLRLVPTDENDYEQYYNQISNRLLWYANHYLWDLPHSPTLMPDIHQAWDKGYHQINMSFAEVIAEETAGARRPLVMLQDYHLLLTGGYLRRLLPGAIITHFLHTPWPQPDYLRVLPRKIRDEIFASLLSCDIVGFHTPGYARNFLWCCRELAGLATDDGEGKAFSGSRECRIRSYPISLERISLREFAESEAVRVIEARLLERHADLSLILRVDRLELSKNAMRGFLAYDLLLERHPELKGKIKFLAYLYPSRTAVNDYLRYKREIEVKVEEINGRHRLPGWEPVEMEIADNYPRSVAALRIYDVLLVNPLFDGMNLVAKEGPLVNRRDGLLVLSENAGAYQELGGSVLAVNPFDVEQTADKLYQALTMPAAERKAVSASLREMVEGSSSLRWLYHQVKDAMELSPARRGRTRSPQL